MLHRRMMMRDAAAPLSITYLGRTAAANVSSLAVPTQADAAGDLIVALMHDDDSSIGSVSAPLVNFSNGGNVARIASFEWTDETSVTFPQACHPALVGFRGNCALVESAYGSGNGQVITFPSVSVPEPGCAILLHGFRRSAGGTGGLTYSIPDSELIHGAGASRQFTILIEDQSEFEGATVEFVNTADDWSAAVAVVGRAP